MHVNIFNDICEISWKYIALKNKIYLKGHTNISKIFLYFEIISEKNKIYKIFQITFKKRNLFILVRIQRYNAHSCCRLSLTDIIIAILIIFYGIQKFKLKEKSKINLKLNKQYYFAVWISNT